MSKSNPSQWSSLRIGITGASGKLGRALTKKLKSKGAFVIGLTSKPIDRKDQKDSAPDEWINWKCGEESTLDEILDSLNILILNHGINAQGSHTNEAINKSLEINAISSWKLIQRFESLANANKENLFPRELWINTSEAEIQPALSPTYEISKRLLGELVTIKMKTNNKNNKLIIRKLVLGPFRSKLNPIGIMNPDFVASQITALAELNQKLIIVTPNPLTYILMPLSELIKIIYLELTQRFNIPSKE